MKDRTLDYLNQLRPLITNSRNQGQQIYKNYRNEGMSNYPHMRDYEKTMAQLQAEKENEPNIINQYQQNKLNLDQSEAEKYKALQGQNKIFKKQIQPKTTSNEPLSLGQQQLQNMKQSMASIWPQKKNVVAARPIAQPVQQVAQKVISSVQKAALKPRTLFTIAPDTPVIFHNTQQGNGPMSQYSLPFSTYGANHSYMKLMGENLNHGKWFDPNNGRFFNTQFGNT
jgi:hypothetical protein